MILANDITFRNMTATPALEQEVRDEIEKLERYYDSILRCSVVVEEHGGRKLGKLWHVRIDLVLPQGELVVRHEPNLHAAAVDTGETRQVKGQEVGAEHRDPGRAIRDAFALARRRLQDYARRQRGDVKSRTEALVGARVVELLAADGYGFCMTEGGKRLYFHRNSVLNGGFEKLRIGTEVKVLEEMGEQGPQASTVRLARPRKQVKVSSGIKLIPPKRGKA